MTVEKDRLHLGQKRKIAVEVPPPHLHHADFRIGEVIDRTLEHVRLRHEIRIQNKDKLTLRGVHATGQRAGLESLAIHAVDVFDIESPRLEAFRFIGRNLAGLVRRIVQNLDLQQFFGIIELAHRLDQTPDHVVFVKNRQLHRHPRQMVEFAGGFRRLSPVFQKQIEDAIAMNAIG